MLKASCLTLKIKVKIEENEEHSVPSVQYIQRIVRVGGCPAVMAQWQSTGGSSQKWCRGFDSRPLPAFPLSLFSPHNIYTPL